MQKYGSICFDVWQHLDHSPTRRVLESFAPARGDYALASGDRASVKYTPCRPIVNYVIPKVYKDCRTGQLGYVILRRGLRGLLSRVGFASTLDYRCAASMPLSVLTHY